MKFFAVQQNRTKGFTMIEMLAAVFIFSTALVALTTFIARAVFSGAQARNEVIAQFLANEGAEVVLNIRDTNFLHDESWLDGIGTPCAVATGGCQISYNASHVPTLSACSSVCSRMWQLPSSEYISQTGTGIQTPFTRTIAVTPLANSYEVLVTSTVSWEVRSVTHNVVNSFIMTDWYPTS